jgi:hypothetical protein
MEESARGSQGEVPLMTTGSLPRQGIQRTMKPSPALAPVQEFSYTPLQNPAGGASHVALLLNCSLSVPPGDHMSSTGLLCAVYLSFTSWDRCGSPSRAHFPSISSAHFSGNSSVVASPLWEQAIPSGRSRRRPRIINSSRVIAPRSTVQQSVDVLNHS